MKNLFRSLGRHTSKFLGVIGIFLIAHSATAANAPETLPTCSEPQQAAPQAVLGYPWYTGTDVAFDGSEYAAVWYSWDGTPTGDSGIGFRKYFADGTPDGAQSLLGVNLASNSIKPRILWSGNEYAVVFGDSQRHMFFVRVNKAGVALMSPVQISDQYFFVWDPLPHLAYGGGSYLVTWAGSVNSYPYNMEVYYTLLNASGQIITYEKNITNAAGNQSTENVAWSSLAQKFILAWTDLSTASYPFNASYIAPDGTEAYQGNLFQTPGSTVGSPEFVDAGARMALVWKQDVGSNNEIYFATFPIGGQINAAVRVTNDPGYSGEPHIHWTGSEYVLFFDDNRTGAYYELFARRIAADGIPIGADIRITTTPGLSLGNVAYGDKNFMAAVLDGSGSAAMLIPIGCALDITPPSCPGNFIAYGVSGSTASISWSPSGDSESDLAYYEIFRDNQSVKRTGDRYFNDSGLTTSTTYNYMVQPVNAAHLQNFACTSSINIRTNSTLTLLLNKSNTDIRLNWTDEGAAQYTYSSGDSPQLMHSIGQSASITAIDAGALTAPASTFYSVDIPTP